MKILFMGTPEFAVPSLEALISAGHTICGVFTQPDRPKNRGMKMLPPPVKELAITYDIPVFQPERLKESRAFEQISGLAPELIVVAAYGQILPLEILELPKYGCINVHSSLLPKYRGAAPINWAIVNGETETGVTIMYMAKALDAGDIISQSKTPIAENESAQQLHDRLAVMGGMLLTETVVALGNGTAVRTPQNAEEVTYAPMLSRALSTIDWTKPALTIHNQIRGLNPWPATVTDILDHEPVKIYASCLTGESTQKAAGTVLAAAKSGIDVACGDGKVLRLTELQAQGKRKMSADDYLRGHPLVISAG